MRASAAAGYATRARLIAQSTTISTVTGRSTSGQWIDSAATAWYDADGPITARPTWLRLSNERAKGTCRRSSVASTEPKKPTSPACHGGNTIPAARVTGKATERMTLDQTRIRIVSATIVTPAKDRTAMRFLV